MVTRKIARGAWMNPAETGFYYLASRYYDPETGRFINADTYISTGQSVLGFNMYEYCLNNPVNYVDRGGTDAEALQWWAGAMWWLPLVDGVIPVGDLVYLAGCAAIGFIGLIVVNEVIVDNPIISVEENPLNNEEIEDDYDLYNEYGFDEDDPTNEKVGKQKGNTPRNNKNQNKQVDYLTRGKSKKFRRAFHDEISGQGFDFKELIDLLE